MLQFPAQNNGEFQKEKNLKIKQLEKNTSKECLRE